MPHALLLSPDDQAVSAITGVLEEMSVTFERPLDGPSAAKKLTSHSFDLVLVDCENLPAAKLIFDVCRRSQTGTNPVPIAIVDGRAGLPTAFRLGAELILTKPVAKDQARTTIRTAVSRVRKDDVPRTIQPIEEAPAEMPQSEIPETHAHAAAASAISSLARIAEHAPSVAPLEPLVAKMNSVVEESAPAIRAPKAQPPSSLEMLMPRPVEPPKSASPLKASPEKLSDDPVLADLESDLPTPVSASYAPPKEKEKTSGLLVTLFLLVAVGGGLYAAWMYVPAFREVAAPQVDRILALIGKPRQAQAVSPAPQTSPAPAVTAPVSQPPASDTVATTVPASESPAESSASEGAVPSAGTDAPATQSAEPAPKASSATKPPAPAEAKSVIAAIPSDTELPGEKSAVILSSQGAEKRLIHHQQPAYPAEARKEKIEGTVILKAIVGESGKVEGVRLVEGNPTLAAAAITAVKRWTYRPYLRDGKAMRFQTVVLVDFQRP